MPEEHVTLRVAGDESIAIGAEGELPEVLARPFQGDEFLSGGGGPELNGFVAVTACGQAPVVQGEGQRLNRTFVGAEGTDLVEHGHGPDLYHAFCVSDRQETSVW
jgi:hypothetical protein